MKAFGKQTALTAAMGLLLSGLSFADDPAVRVEVSEEGVAVQAGSSAAAQDASFYRASDLIGMEVKGANDTDLGEVQDLLVNSQTHEIEYFLLDTGLLAGIDGNFTVIPWVVADAHIGPGVEEQYILVDIAQERLRQAPSVNFSEEAALENPEWTAEVATFYEQDLRERPRTTRRDRSDRDPTDRPGARRDRDDPERTPGAADRSRRDRRDQADSPQTRERRDSNPQSRTDDAPESPSTGERPQRDRESTTGRDRPQQPPSSDESAPDQP